MGAGGAFEATNQVVLAERTPFVFRLCCVGIPGRRFPRLGRPIEWHEEGKKQAQPRRNGLSPSKQVIFLTDRCKSGGGRSHWTLRRAAALLYRLVLPGSNLESRLLACMVGVPLWYRHGGLTAKRGARRESTADKPTHKPLSLLWSKQIWQDGR